MVSNDFELLRSAPSLVKGGSGAVASELRGFS